MRPNRSDVSFDGAAGADHFIQDRNKRHCHGDPGLRGSQWPGSPTPMNKVSYSGYRFPPEIIQQAIWLYLRFTLSLHDVEDLLAERGVAVSYETVRRWVNHFGPMIAAVLRKRRLKPHTTWHLDEVYLKIDGRMVYLWRAVDAEGEVLDVLVQSKRNKHAALKLMRKLLRSMPSLLSGWSPTTCDHTAPRFESLGSNAGMSGGDGRTIELRIRISQRGGGSARCSGSKARVQPRGFFPLMPPSTIPSTSNAISSRPKRTRASHRRDDHVADRSRSGLTIHEAPILRARGTAT